MKKTKKFWIILVSLGITLIVVLIFVGFWLLQAYKINRLAREEGFIWREVDNLEAEIEEKQEEVNKIYDEAMGMNSQETVLANLDVFSKSINDLDVVIDKNNKVLSKLDSISETISSREKIITPRWYKQYLSILKEAVSNKREIIDISKSSWLKMLAHIAAEKNSYVLKNDLNQIREAIEKEDNWTKAESLILIDQKLVEEVIEANKNYEYMTKGYDSFDILVLQEQIDKLNEYIEDENKNGVAEMYFTIDSSLNSMNLRITINRYKIASDLREADENIFKTREQFNNKMQESFDFYENGGGTFLGKILVEIADVLGK